MQNVLIESKNVIEQIVSNNLCVGCGVCAGTCPVACLEMRFNQYGEYNPFLCDECIECGKCLQVCPFADNGWNEDTLVERRFKEVTGIKHTSEMGYFLHCYAGHMRSEKLRFARSSGGLASWFLAKLLEQEIVDKVLCVVNNHEHEKLFRFAVLKNPKDVRNAAKSAYYPVEMSEALRVIRKEEGRYAIIGLPCFIKGLQKACREDPILAERIRIFAGLVCGQLKGKFYSEYLLRYVGADPLNVRSISFREKQSGLPSSEYIFKYEANQKPIQLQWSNGYGRAWVRGYFKLNACNFCDDVFAELADIVFMDAWLPEDIPQSAGTNLVLVRTPMVDEIVSEG